jgi:hypothetical protein
MRHYYNILVSIMVTVFRVVGAAQHIGLRLEVRVRLYHMMFSGWKGGTFYALILTPTVRHKSGNVHFPLNCAILPPPHTHTHTHTHTHFLCETYILGCILLPHSPWRLCCSMCLNIGTALIDSAGGFLNPKLRIWHRSVKPKHENTGRCVGPITHCS